MASRESRGERTDRTGESSRLLRYLTHRRLPLMLATVGVLLALPSLWGGWVADDHFHRLKLVGSPALAASATPSLDLFTFASGDPEQNHRLIDKGFWPWWSLQDLRAAFWRPITALTHWVDYRFWPESPAWMHAQSIAWFALLIVVATMLFRRIMGATWIAGLAALFYAIDDARGMPVGFLANRNALIAGVFGMLAILAHDRWRRDGWKSGAVLGPGLLLASLLSAEAGVGALAYLVAHALFLDRARGRRRVAALLPYAAVVTGWRMVWSHLGYGVMGIGLYVDPLREPLKYLASAAKQVPVLLLGQWALPPSETYVVAAEFGAALVLSFVALGLVGAMAAVVIPMLRRNRQTGFWGSGMILSLLPICATFPADRMTLFVGLGAFALLAQWLADVYAGHGALEADGARPRRRFGARALAAFFVVVHGGLAPIGLAMRSAMPAGPRSWLESISIHVPLDVEVEEQSLVVVTAPLVMGAGYLPIRNALDGLPVPAHTRILAPHQAPVLVQRPDAHTLTIRPTGGFLKSPWDQLARSLDYPMSLGQRVHLTDVVIEITGLTADNRPAEATFHFAAPLEDPSLRWLYWDGDTYAPFPLPAIGETVVLTNNGLEPMD